MVVTRKVANKKSMKGGETKMTEEEGIEKTVEWAMKILGIATALSTNRQWYLAGVANTLMYEQAQEQASQDKKIKAS